jgi:hypothetical protein
VNKDEMKVNCKIVLLTVAIAAISVGNASAQKTQDANNTLSKTSLATEGGTGSSTTPSGKNTPPPPPPSEKKKWAIQVTQGEKWYQLSVKLVM